MMLKSIENKQGRLIKKASWLLMAFLIAGVPTGKTWGQAEEADVKIKIVTTSGKKQEAGNQKAPFTGTRASVDVAILLDTSNSMDGLISQAKSQLWTIVQQFADAKKNGQTPILRVAIFEYGNSGLPASENYIRQAVGLTDDLDKVSEVLFALTTNGGDEYCGAVIGEAMKRLDWSNEPNAYKAIFVSGNEPFNQGPIDYKKSCKHAIECGVIVNTIHCGDRTAGVSGGWEIGSQLAEGSFLNINQDQRVVHISCPQDKVLIELGTHLNRTYLWFGASEDRRAYSQNQIAQDSNASKGGGRGGGRGGGVGGGGGGRAAAKASAVYRNQGRDLVDTYEADHDILTKVKKEELPDDMQKMTADEQLAYLKKMLADRNEIKKKINELSIAREVFLTEELAKEGDAASATLGGAMKTVVKEQLERSGFDVKK